MIGFIGVGNMAQAIISGIIENDILKPEQIGLLDPHESKVERFKGSVVYRNCADLVKSEDIIFFCVKPNVVCDVLNDIVDGIGYNSFENKTFVTIAAGISTGFIKSVLGEDTKVIRVMPNTPMLVGKGVCAIADCNGIDSCIKSKIDEIFNALGSVRYYDESKLNAIISLTSSSPAYVFLMAKALSEGAEKQGFDKQDSLILAADVLEGAAAMIKNSGKSADELIDAVTSKGGTTRAALDVFEKNGFTETVCEAMMACTRRAEELAK